jgi:hypothetical protein
MIQRIQSLYLLIVFIGCTVLFFVPIAYFKSYEFYIYGVRLIGGDFASGQYIKFIALIILNALTGLLALFILFQYKNRNLQIKLVRLNIFINTFLIAAMFFYYIDKISVELLAKTNYTIYSAIPIITLILLILCVGAIYKDEKLVRSADRLR